MRRKAIQAQETALDLRERLKPVLEALQPLTEANREKVGRVFLAVGEKALAEQQEGQRLAKLDTEKRRRIEALPGLERRTAGRLTRSCSTHGQHWPRLGDASRVEWTKVEGAAAREAISQNGQEPKDVAQAICQHSPFGRIRPAMPRSRPGYRRRPQPGSSSTKPSTTRRGQAWGARRPATPAPGLAGHPGQCQAPWLQ